MIWKPVVGYEGIYEVSDSGQVRSLDRFVCNRWKTPFKVRGVLLKNRVNQKSGHLRVILYLKGKRFDCFIHRLVLEAFIGSCPEGMQCCHLDGDPTNNKLENLRWGTQAENAADSIRHGTFARGERSGMSKLTKEAVREIRSTTGYGSAIALAEKFGVRADYISKIKRRRAWKHI